MAHLYLQLQRYWIKVILIEFFSYVCENLILQIQH